MSRDDTLRETQRIVFEVWVRSGRPEQQKQGIEGLALLDAGEEAPAIWRDETKPKEKPRPRWLQELVKPCALELVAAAVDPDGGMGDRE